MQDRIIQLSDIWFTLQRGPLCPPVQAVGTLCTAFGVHWTSPYAVNTVPTHILYMRILASIFCGWMVWASFVIWRLSHPEIAVLAGIVSVFVCEATIHRAERKGLQRERLQLRQQLNLSAYNINQLQESLSNVQAELHRRDIIGTPAARELLKRQEEAINAQSSALEDRTSRQDRMFVAMERLLAFQTEQTAAIQQSLAELLTQLASEPRQHVTMTDSVLVQNQEEERMRRQFRRMSDEFIADLFE